DSAPVPVAPAVDGRGGPTAPPLALSRGIRSLTGAAEGAVGVQLLAAAHADQQNQPALLAQPALGTDHAVLGVVAPGSADVPDDDDRLHSAHRSPPDRFAAGAATPTVGAAVVVIAELPAPAPLAVPVEGRFRPPRVAAVPASRQADRYSGHVRSLLHRTLMWPACLSQAPLAVVG